MGGRTILIDTSTGNDKNLPSAPRLDHLHEPFLERLAAIGIRPEAVDLVLSTHLHADHVGWNTRLEKGRWVPTFPNAQHIFSRTEQRYNASLLGIEPSNDLPPATMGSPVRRPHPEMYMESVMPVIEAGLAKLIDVDGVELFEHFSYLPTPGHSVDHASIRMRSRGQQALFLGDVLHHPLQVLNPDLRSAYCEFVESARASRRWALEYAAEHNLVCFSTHFPESGAGRISRHGDRFRWQYEGISKLTMNNAITNSCQTLEILCEDELIPSDTAGIRLRLRRKRLAGVEHFTAERTVLLMHGATFSSMSLFNVPIGGS